MKCYEQNQFKVFFIIIYWLVELRYGGTQNIYNYICTKYYLRKENNDSKYVAY